MQTGLDLTVIYSFIMEHWIVIGVVAFITIRIIKKAVRLTKRALYLMYTLSGGLAGMGLITDIWEFIIDKF